jgi:outer membrane protein assembly factor BamB
MVDSRLRMMYTAINSPLRRRTSMSRRLIACLAIAFLLAACHVVVAQNLPGIPGGGSVRVPGAPPPPPGSGAEGVQQQNNYPGDNVNMPGGNPPEMGAGVQPPAEEKPEEPVPVIDTELSPGLQASPMSQASDNWPMSGRDITHSCYTPYKFTYPLRLLWKYVTKQPSVYPSSPVVADGIMYFATASRLYAMNAETGLLYWRWPEDVALRGGISTTPLVGNDFVYIGSGDKHLYAIKKGTGALVWQFRTNGGISGSPVLYNDSVYFGSGDYSLYQLNARTGSPVWKGGFKTGDAINGSPIVAGGLVYFLSDDTNLYAVSPSGAYRRAGVGAPSRVSSPVFGDNMIYVYADGVLKALQAQSLYQLWAFALPSRLTTAPVYANGTLFLACEDHMLYAVTRAGRAKWKAPTDLKVMPMGTPVIAGDTILIGGGMGRITAVDCATGIVKWTYDCQPSEINPPVGSRAVTTGRSSQLGGVSSSLSGRSQGMGGPQGGGTPAVSPNGKYRYEYVNMTSPMVVYNGTLYTFSDDGTLFAFRSDIADTTPPTVLQVAPTPGSILPGAGTLTAAALVTDEGSGIDWSTASLLFDDKPVEFKLKPEHNLIYWKRIPKTEGVVDVLSDGRHTLSLSVTDWAGNRIDKEWNFIADNTLTVSPEEKQALENARSRTPGAGNGPGGIGGPGAGVGGGIGGRGMRGPGMGGPGAF